MTTETGFGRCAISGMQLLCCCAVAWAAGCSQDMAGAPQRLSTALEAARQGDYGEAYWIWRELAGAGLPEAQYQLGWLYANGNGLRVDVLKAIEWWEKAARTGHAEAAFALAMAYLNGEHQVLEPDMEIALAWLLEAGDHGSADAGELVARLLHTRGREVLAISPGLLARPWIGQPVVVVDRQAELRAAPSGKAAVTGRISEGATVRRIGEQEGWVHLIRADGSGLAWVAAENLSFDGDAAP